MKRVYIITLLAAIMSAAGCSMTETVPQTPLSKDGEKVFAAASETSSKAYVEALKVLWDASDELAVFDDAGSQKEIFALKSGAGTSAATFVGKVSTAAAEFFAAYPSAGASAYSDGLLAVNVPAAQSAPDGGHGIDPSALVGVASTTGSDLAFKNVVSAIRFRIDMEGIVSVSLKGNSDETVAGTVKVDPKTGLVSEVAEAASEVVLTPAGESFAKGQYIISLLPAQFNHGVTLSFTDKDGNVTKRSNENSLAIARNRLLDLTAFIHLADTEYSFKPGQTREIRVLSQGVSGLSVHGAPEGWTVDASALDGGLLKVTAPAAGATAPGTGTFDLRGTLTSGDPIASDDITIRLYGINDKAEFLAFRSLYQGDDETDNARLNAPVTDEAVVGKYLVDGALTLNADLSFDSEDLLLKAYIIKYLVLPLDGNGHTINVDFTGEAGVCALFQYLTSNVSDLVLSGAISYPYEGNGRVAPLATLTGNSTVTVKNLACAVNMSATGKVQDLGGVIAYANGGDITLDGCTYSGTVTYDPAELNAAPAFGGLVGRSAAASLTIKNSVSSGTFNFDLHNRPLCTADASGLGGILGLAVAGKAASFENVENKSAITIDNVSVLENKDRFSQTVGNNAAEADLGGIAANGTLTFNDFAGYALAFAETEMKTLAYGASTQLNFAVSPAGTSVSSIAVKEVPEGWTIDLSHAKDATPYIVVSAPSQDAIKAGSAVGTGEIVLEATLPGGYVATNVDKPSVRLYGINDKAEFKSFISAYGASANSPNITGLDNWLVDGAITLNTDLTVETGDLATFYVVKFLDLPLEGNNRTITYNVTSAQALVAFCQGLHADVSNLYFDGSITATGKSAEVCMLAARGINTNGSSRKATEVTITNVHIKSTAIISFEYDGTGSGAYVAGFVSKGTEAGSTLTYRNCSVAGTIQSIKGAPQGLAGFSGADGTGVGIWSKFYDCSFTGAIRLEQGLNKAGSIRIGGLVADNCRNSYYENCTSSGTITADMNGYVFNTSSSKGSGIGGLVGYTQNTSEGSSSEFKNCSFSGSISAVNMLASTAEYGWTDAGNYDSSITFGKIVGNASRKAPSGLDTCTESGSITYSFAE